MSAALRCPDVPPGLPSWRPFCCPDTRLEPTRMSLRPRPSIRELPGDLLTPVGAYLRIRDLGPGFLLESIERGQQVGRYSFLGAGCEVVTLDHGAADPFAPLREFLALHADAGTAGLPPFAGGVVGHL